MPKKETELELSQRAERISAAITYLESQKAEMKTNVLVAPVGCSIVLEFIPILVP